MISAKLCSHLFIYDFLPNYTHSHLVTYNIATLIMIFAKWCSHIPFMIFAKLCSHSFSCIFHCKSRTSIVRRTGHKNVTYFLLNFNWKLSAGKIQTSRISWSNCSEDSQCLKITEKVAFNIASEASYIYILS